MAKRPRQRAGQETTTSRGAPAWRSRGAVVGTAALAIVVAVAGILLLRSRSLSASRPNILLITLDTTRADHLGAYGYRLGATEHLDRLASQGVLFERTVSAAPITLPAHTSLFTALNPFTHGVRNNGNFSLKEGVPTLATALHEHGYRTAAFVSSFVLDHRRGLARGFDHYDDRVEGGASSSGTEVERRGDRTALAAGEWLTDQMGGAGTGPSGQDRRAANHSPLFVWIHLYDPHDPYDPPSPFRETFAQRPYDGEIAFDDTVVGSVIDRLDRLGLLSSTLIAVVGDHGESLGDHGEVTHSMFVYEATQHVPMIVWWPGHLPSGSRVAPLVRAIDLAPTLLDLIGLPPLAGAEGRSLLPLVRGHAAAAPASAYAETYFPLFYMNWSPLRSIQDDRWKFIDAPTAELYDLTNDPREQTNLADREPARTEALRRALNALMPDGAARMAPDRMDRDTVERLASLGYVGAGGAASTPAVPDHQRPDPKAMIGVFNRLRRANADVHEGRLGEAEALARDVLARDRDNAFATVVLASAEMEQGKFRDGLAHYRAYSALVPSSADAHHWMAICLVRLGDRASALREEDAALAIDPGYADAHDLRGGLLARSGRVQDAIADLTAAVQINPKKTDFHVGLARVLADSRRFEDAEREYRVALDLEPGSVDAHAGYGTMLGVSGSPDRAVAEFERALEIQPDRDDVRVLLAQALDRLGRHAEARTEYERLASDPRTPADIKRTAHAALESMRQGSR
jgi:arylsulfatase A-like enzyme/Tfp pilus assembly protein PilF